ncbi:MAG: class I SAM-dependent methyltransferase [Parvularculaceae bacterium]
MSGLHEHPPADVVDRQKEHFNRIAPAYVAGRNERNHIVVKDLIWEAAVRGVKFDLPPRFSVIEPMCGVGDGCDFARKHLGPDFSYAGFDYSDEIVRSAKEQMPGADIWRADATTVELPSARYDAAIILGGLHHVPFHVPQVLASVTRSLKPGGYFINFEPTSGNPAFAKAREIIYERNAIFDAGTERAFTVPQLKSLFEEAGLRPERITFPGLAAYALYYNPYAFPQLNVGSEGLVRKVFSADRLFLSNAIGKFFSFATFSIWRKPAG